MGDPEHEGYIWLSPHEKRMLSAVLHATIRNKGFFLPFRLEQAADNSSQSKMDAFMVNLVLLELSYVRVAYGDFGHHFGSRLRNRLERAAIAEDGVSLCDIKGRNSEFLERVGMYW